MSDTARQTADDGFHEIQLTGKQLVFLFMATTVVAVVIFLCGVLVGRGARTDRTAAEGAPAGTELPGGGPAAPPASVPTQSAEPSPANAEDLSYARRLQGEEPKEQLKPGGEAPDATTAEPPTPDETAPDASSPTAAAGAAATPGPQETRAGPASQGWVVQVAALRDRAAAVSIIQRLGRKGYQAFIVEPARGAPATGYRIRVGPFQDRGQAEQVSRRLEREEQFKPFITR